MSLHLRGISGRSFPLLAIVGLLAASAPGCDNSASTQKGGDGQIAPSVQESNKTMQDFMKSQAAAKKK